MATIIVPQDTPTQTADYHPTTLEIHSLALELCEAEGLTYANAVVAAARDLAYCQYYAEEWDRMAFMAGNDDALPF